VLGTAAYISPEQASGEPATPASDVYSFGVLLFRMLTGALPFVAEDALALVDMHRNRPAPPVASVNPAADPVLAGLADASLAKDPAMRPGDGAALLAALTSTVPVAAAATVVDPNATRVMPVAAPVGAPIASVAARRRGAVAIAAALLLLGTLGGVLAWAVTRPPAASPSGIVTTHKRRTTTTNPFSSTTIPSLSTATTQSTTTKSTQSTSTSTRTTTPTTSPATTQVTTTQPATTTAPTTTTTAPPTTTAAAATTSAGVTTT
jgi:serine/threonine-protein kinase